MILKTPHGDVETRDLFAGSDQIPRPSMGVGGGFVATTGRVVGVGDIVGLPAYMMGVRLLSETLGTLPCMVFRGYADDEKERAPDTPQWALLHDKPNEQQSPYQFWTYVTACRQGWPGAFIQKTKALLRADRRVMELIPMDPATVMPKMQNGELVFKVVAAPGQGVATLTRSDVLYVPAVLFNHPLIGTSPVQAHREALGGAVALQEYGNRFFGNDATPGVVLTAGESTTRQQRDEAKQSWEANHRATRMSHRTAVLPAGWAIERLSVSPQDAQYIEGQRWSVEQVARVLKVPGFMLGIADPAQARLPPEQRNMEFLQFGLLPHIRAVEQAFHADDDVFPDKTLRPEFTADMLLRPDTPARYAAYVQGRQAGWLSINDIRAKEGMPAIEGGDSYQATPVGGAPNLQPDASSNGDGGGDRGFQLHVNERAFEVHPPTVNVTPRITVRNQIPEQQPPTVKVPRQAAPVVNVAAPNVTVHNDVPVPSVTNEVPVPEVTVDAPVNVTVPERTPRANMRLIRDTQGRVSGAEIE